MLFAVILKDAPSQPETRQKYLPDHIRFSEANADKILLAGSLSSEIGGGAAGGLWIVEAKDRAAVESLCHEDPFWIAGLRSAIEIYQWGREFPDQPVSL